MHGGRTGSIEDCRSLAAARGGECLSTHYVNCKTHLLWRCANGHEWKAKANHIQQGRWCRRCGNDKRRADNFERVKELARERGGECVSKVYAGSNYPLRWRCAEGHTWLTTPDKIALGHWCRRCAGTEKLTLRQMQALARKRGGECLSDSYESTNGRLLWRCSEGHEWLAQAGAVIYRETWCPHCAGNFQMEPADIVALAEELAASRKGELLSRRITAVNAKVRWRCELGHEFAMSTFHVQDGKWCARCRAAPSCDLDRLRGIAQRRGGECLSKRYLGSQSKHRWRCSAGHVWDAIASQITGGSWCRICSQSRGPRPVLDISDMQETAEARGGQCLSEEYVNSTTKLLWRCRRGHEWEAAPNSVRQGGWCPMCAHRYRGSVDGLQRLAADRGGALVSRRYESRRKPLTWECARGHRFDLTSLAAKSGAWCPHCVERPDPREAE